LFSTERFGNEEIVEVLKNEFQHRPETERAHPDSAYFVLLMM